MNVQDQIKELERLVANAKKVASSIQTEQRKVKAEVSAAADFVAKGGGSMDRAAFATFLKKPYAIIPQGKSKVLVAVPKFVSNFQVGWLWKETDSFYIYQFDQYSAWLGDAPVELLESIGFEKGFDLEVNGSEVTFSKEHREAIKKKLGAHLREVSDTSAIITRGHVFDVIAETIKNGCLPFKAMPVDKADVRPMVSKIKFRPYQEAAAKKFLETGAVGVFHPTGAGKSFLAMGLIDMLKGDKVIIVPTRTLVEQWWHYIETNIPERKREVRIFTYQGFRELDRPPTLMIFDECQRLPANTFSRLAVVPAKYRIGLSASPHREDGRENYIFALTGFPIGLNWQEYMATAKKSYHPIYAHVVRSAASKIKKLDELLDRKKKTMIFCDTISIGKEIARRYDVPYIYGATKDRMAQFQDNKIVCVSRVGDLGVSIKDLNQIIEVDFLFGSRQQELQRTGRLMHSEEAERHDIIMTEKEFSEHGKRLWALQEKGFTIKVA